jgi:hypothetical protein
MTGPGSCIYDDPAFFAQCRQVRHRGTGPRAFIADLAAGFIRRLMFTGVIEEVGTVRAVGLGEITIGG